ncbi:UNVERIFIED_CONTAM: hypothetical protein K2H54_023857 [Gekko kuhli]
MKKLEIFKLLFVSSYLIWPLPSRKQELPSRTQEVTIASPEAAMCVQIEPFCYDQGSSQRMLMDLYCFHKSIFFGQSQQEVTAHTGFMFIIQYISQHQLLDFGHTSVKILSMVIHARRCVSVVGYAIKYVGWMRIGTSQCIARSLFGSFCFRSSSQKTFHVYSKLLGTEMVFLKFLLL